MTQPLLPDDDKELLNAFRNEATREAAFTKIIKKYQEKLYWHVRRLVINHEDANDVLQNVFIKVWNYLDNFREEGIFYVRDNDSQGTAIVRGQTSGVDVGYIAQTLHRGKHMSLGPGTDFSGVVEDVRDRSCGNSCCDRNIPNRYCHRQRKIVFVQTICRLSCKPRSKYFGVECSTQEKNLDNDFWHMINDQNIG